MFYCREEERCIINQRYEKTGLNVLSYGFRRMFQTSAGAAGIAAEIRRCI